MIARFLILALAAAAGGVSGRTADDYFHAGSHRYVAGRLQEAAVEVEEGLNRHPDDPRLQALLEQIESLKDQQRQDGSGGGDGSGGDDDRRDSAEDGRPDGQDQRRQNPPEEKEREGRTAGSRPGEDNAGGEERDAPHPPEGGMSRDEAERLLDAFADDEKREQAERARRIRQRPGMEKDW